MIFHYKPFILGVPSFYWAPFTGFHRPRTTSAGSLWRHWRGRPSGMHTDQSKLGRPATKKHGTSIKSINICRKTTYIYILNMCFILMANRCNDINDYGFMSIFPWKPLIRADFPWVQKLDRDDADQVDHVLWHCVMMISRCFGSFCYFYIDGWNTLFIIYL